MPSPKEAASNSAARAKCRSRRHPGELRGGAIDRARVPPGGVEVDARARHPRISGALSVSDDREREGLSERGTGGGVERCSDDIGRSARQALVEMQTDLLVAAAREQRVYETLPLLTLKERGRQPQRVIAVQE